jgi:hypothetical protein
MRGRFLLVSVVTTACGVAMDFLSTLLFNQFAGYRPAIKRFPVSGSQRTSY